MTARLLMTADAVGGVWQYATDLARALRPLGYETTIALLGPEPSDAQRATLLSRPARGEREIHLLTTGLALDWLAPGPEAVLAAGDAIARLARDVGADLVQLNSPALAAPARFGVPTVAVAHGCVATWWEAAHGGEPPVDYRWQVNLVRAGLLAADTTVAPTRAYAEAVQRRYALPRAPIPVHNGRAPPVPSPLVEQAQAQAPAAQAFTAGRLWDRVKNTAVLDRVAERLSVPFLAAGPVSGPHEETVAPRHLRLLGNLSAADLAGELARRPVFVSAATFEPFGLAVLEAAQAGCALVLSDIPSFRELWDGAALFVPPDEEVEIAGAIESLLADPERRARFGAAARAQAARYTPDATAAAMAGLYAGLLDGRRAAA